MALQYNARSKRAHLLHALGADIRARRLASNFTLKSLAEATQVSERFLVQLEQGDGNISVARLADVAAALGTSSSALLARAEAKETAEIEPVDARIVALLGLRGAGKSTIGPRLAKRLDAPFVELDALVAREAGMKLSTIFELHGEDYFRNVEREALRKFLESHQSAVIATSGSIVTAKETYALLQRRTMTVWLKARAQDHWDRVVAQGDGRPMKDRANAMNELKSLLKSRTPLYAQAFATVDTSKLAIDDAVEKVFDEVVDP
jgi:XRE family transcriptional regulator, aerobic/anaerobic benzoate catabolism transcriptional regulator